MSRSATAAVRIAAAFLPRELGNRYREQWLGDLRDASDVGVSTAEIARGALAFAATYTRPLPSWAPVWDRAAALRVRFAVALSFSSAIVSISQYSILGTSPGSDQWGPAGLVVQASTQMLAGFTMLAPLLALVVVFAARATDSRVRLSVGLFALASVLPLTQQWIDDRFSPEGAFYTRLGPAVFPIAIALVIAAATLLARTYRPFARPDAPQRLSRRLLTSTAAGLVIGIVVIAGFASMTGLWDARTPLVFRPLVNEANRAEYTQWLLVKFQFEALVSTIFGVWIVAGLAIACFIAASGLSARATRQRSAVIFGVAILSSAVIYGGIICFLQIAWGPTVSTSIELLMAAGRWGLIGIVMTAILRTSATSDAHRGNADRAIANVHGPSDNLSLPAPPHKR